jgi:hypothetical protein
MQKPRTLSHPIAHTLVASQRKQKSSASRTAPLSLLLTFFNGILKGTLAVYGHKASVWPASLLSFAWLVACVSELSKANGAS